MALGVRYYEEAGDPAFPVDPLKAMRIMYASIQRAMVLGVERDGALCGALRLDDEAPWWTSAKALFEAGLYLAPEGRQGGGAALLLDAGKAVAESAGVPFIITPFTVAQLGLKDRWFRARGFRQIGAFYRWG